MFDTSTPIILVMRNDGQIADENGHVVFASLAALREAYDLPADQGFTWPVGHPIRFPR
jgi:hypothetical protein